MRGTNASVPVMRTARNGTVTTVASALPCRIQPLALDLTVEHEGVLKTAVLTCDQSYPLQREDTLTWHGRTWQITNLQYVDGRGAYLRAHLLNITR